MWGARNAGWQVEFACADGRWAATLRREGFGHRALTTSRSIAPHRNSAAVVQLAASLRRSPVDLIHTHTPIGGIVGRAAALVTPAQVVHTFHGLPLRAAALSASERAFLLLERAVSLRTTWFLSQAVGDADRAVRLHIADPRKLTVIGNGVDLARFHPDERERGIIRAELGTPPDDVVVVMVSRLVREKGPLVLADAAERLKGLGSVSFWLVGEALASDRANVTAELDAHTVRRSLGSRWQRLGHRSDVERILRGADIFVLPSFREGLPRTVIEAMASGLPVVASDIPACRELVDHSTGYLVPPGDATRLADAIAALVADPARRAELGAAGLRRALERHDERVVVRTQLELFSRLVA